MSRVEVLVGGRPYTIGCDTGEEVRIRELAGYLDKKVLEVSGGKPVPNDPSFLVLAGLVLADEAMESRATHGTVSTPGLGDQEGKIILSALKHLEKRMDGLAAKLKQA
ncbi:MAG TPA: cell division protein ZapA [Rhodospirillaceae bacterium]|nr:MAG: hypothetical protein A2018_06005 [Alphaproteobacteria bacterium GWF2_58_20]HAU29065.1 cell division protein ZapA [Rhodospirillaceae bacterium]